MSTTAADVLGQRAPATPWARHLGALGLTSAGILFLFARDAGHMASIWWTSSTFNHCLLIVPIIGWLVWQRSAAIASLNPATWTFGLLLIGAGAIGWLLGDAAGVSLFRHAGLVVMLQGAVATLLGRDVTRALAFPLFYLLFLVPAGEGLVPALQGVTARISMTLLAITGIPAHIEGVFISTPTGEFEVAEACSGVKFLVAMFALGVLVANLCFRSWTRRILFVAAALAVPIFANGVRAFATIYVASRTTVDAAEGFDHIVYGWFFFAVIIAALMAGAWRFFDRRPDEAFCFRPSSGSPSGASLSLMLGLAFTLAAAPLLWATTVLASARGTTVPTPMIRHVAGWTRINRDDGMAWAPRFAGADHMVLQRYRDHAGREVDLAVAVYAYQDEGRELVGFGQGAVVPGGAWSWSEAAPAPPGGRADRIVAGGVTRDVLTFYRVGKTATGSEAGVKLATLRARLLGGSQAASAVLISSDTRTGPPRAAIDAFRHALGPVDAVSRTATGG